MWWFPTMGVLKHGWFMLVYDGKSQTNSWMMTELPLHFGKPPYLYLMDIIHQLTTRKTPQHRAISEFTLSRQDDIFPPVTV